MPSPSLDADDDLLYDLAEPRADAMIQSLRAFGYDLPTAIADLVDNSISADAKHIWLEFLWSGTASCIAIIDDGRGMNTDTLKNAMRPGSTSPLAERNAKDLGRFGLGLKTASFSQCKGLTVGSRAEGSDTAIRRWDLDHVTRVGQWRLLHDGTSRMDQFLKQLEGKKSGTLVLWETMDRVIGGTHVDSEEDQGRFLHQAEEVRQHIAMVFHRFLTGPRALKIFLNSQPVKPWDPFLRGVHDSVGVVRGVLENRRVLNKRKRLV